MLTNNKKLKKINSCDLDLNYNQAAKNKVGVQVTAGERATEAAEVMRKINQIGNDIFIHRS